jgi:hypothetical protein
MLIHLQAYSDSIPLGDAGWWMRLAIGGGLILAFWLGMRAR